MSRFAILDEKELEELTSNKHSKKNTIKSESTAIKCFNKFCDEAAVFFQEASVTKPELNGILQKFYAGARTEKMKHTSSTRSKV